MADRRALLAAVALLSGVAGCGADDGGPGASATPSAEPVGKPSQGSVVQYADCGDWRKGTAAEKEATVVALRGQLTAQTSETAASSLPDERAVAILEKACSPDFAKSLRLYKLYARAQAFAPLGNY